MHPFVNFSQFQIPTCHHLLIISLCRKKLFSSLSGKLKIWPLDDGINWAGFLTKTAINTLCHIDIISSCTPATVIPGFSINCNCLSRTDRFAELMLYIFPHHSDIDEAHAHHENVDLIPLFMWIIECRFT